MRQVFPILDYDSLGTTQGEKDCVATRQAHLAARLGYIARALDRLQMSQLSRMEPIGFILQESGAVPLPTRQ